jgi:Tfp pilus assembly protein PilO
MTQSRKWLLGGAAIAVLLFVLGYLFVVTPARNTASEMADQVAFQNESNAKAQARLDLLRKQSAEVPAKLAEVASVQVKMPEDVKQPDLVRMVENQAASAGVDLTAVTPGTPTALGDGSSQIIALPMVLQVSGRYPNIKTYVDDLERLDRAFLITNVEVTSDSDNGDGNMDATITGRFFSLPKSALESAGSTADSTTQPQAAASAKMPKAK